MLHFVNTLLLLYSLHIWKCTYKYHSPLELCFHLQLLDISVSRIFLYRYFHGWSFFYPTGSYVAMPELNINKVLLRRNTTGPQSMGTGTMHPGCFCTLQGSWKMNCALFLSLHSFRTVVNNNLSKDLFEF